MSNLNAIVSKLVLEDLELGNGTVSVPTSTGGTRTGTKLNASGIPLKTGAGTAGEAFTTLATDIDAALAWLKGVATGARDGLMSSADKSKLDSIESGANNYTLTKAGVESVLTGAITSHTHSYLPLTGGTLTGGLSGTSAAFSGTLTAGAGSSVLSGNVATNSYFGVGRASVDGLLASAGSASQFLADATVGDFLFRVENSAKAFRFGPSGGANSWATLNSTGFGVGTTSPGERLEVQAGTVRALIQSTTAGSNAGYRLGAKNPSGAATLTAGYYFRAADVQANSYLSLSADDANDQFIVTRAGNVGIGTTNPDAGGLHLKKATGYARVTVETGANNDETSIMFTGGSGSIGTMAAFGPSTASGPGFAANMLTISNFVNNSGFISFHTNTGGTLAERMRILNAGTIFVGNSAAPGSNPSGGGYFYAEGGALKWRGSSGTVTTIANA